MMKNAVNFVQNLQNCCSEKFHSRFLPIIRLGESLQCTRAILYSPRQERSNNAFVQCACRNSFAAELAAYAGSL